MAVLCLNAGSLLYSACVGPGSAREAVSYTDSIFVGRALSTTVEHDVVEIGGADPERLRTRFVVIERFPTLGSPAGEIDVFTRINSGSLGYQFEVGKSYLILGQRRKGKLFTSRCGGTKPIGEAGEDLAYLHSIPYLPQVGKIDGLIQNDDASSDGWTWAPSWVYTLAQQLLPPELDRYLLKGLSIQLDGEGVSRSAISERAGKFRFWNLRPGMYTLQPKRKDLDFTYNGPFRIVPGANNRFEFSPEVFRRIEGTVKTARGDIAPDIEVDLAPTPSERNLRIAWPAITDEHGHFEIRNIQSGTYYLGVSLGSTPPTSSHPYASWYYPGTTDQKYATILRVGSRPAPETLEVSFSLPPALFSDVVKVQVFTQDGQWIQDANVYVKDVPSRRRALLHCCTSTGTAAFRAFERRSYLIYAFTSLGKEPWFTRPFTFQFEASAPRSLKLVLTEHGEEKWSEIVEQTNKQ